MWKRWRLKVKAPSLMGNASARRTLLSRDEMFTGESGLATSVHSNENAGGAFRPTAGHMLKRQKLG